MSKITTILSAVALCMSSSLVLLAQQDAAEAKKLTESLQSTAKLRTDTVAGWTHTGSIGINFTQIGLSNWAGGGENAISIGGLFTFNPNYRDRDFAWENTIEAGYGLTKLGETEFRKSDDRLILTSRGSMRASGDLRYAGLMDFRTQFTVGRNFSIVDDDGLSPKISNLLAPAFLTVSLGMDYKPTDFFNVMVAPIANRTVFVLDDELAEIGSFGLDPGERIHTEMGAVLNMFFRYEIVTNVTVQSRLNTFFRYAELNYAVVTWENLILMKVNEYISVSLATDVLYDHRINVLRNDETRGPATQMRNIFAAGFIYNL